MGNMVETVFAKSSGAGVSAICVIRISGPDALKTINTLLKSDLKSPPRYAVLRTLWWGKVKLDQALIIYFAKESSFTGEETVEIHLHGSKAIIDMTFNALNSFENIRPAGPGDFTLQALKNGKLNLSQVEGLANLINAETEAQKILADKLFSGNFNKTVECWRSKLLNIKANIEASIDFAEENIELDIEGEVKKPIDEIIGEISKEVAGSFYVEKINRGFEVAIVGGPNVGKSTLLNCLVGEEVSIVSEIPGTTRDVIEKKVNIGGHLVSIFDCAGLRETVDPIEKIGVERTEKRANSSDLRIFLKDTPGEGDPTSIERKKNDIVLVSKIDIKNGFEGYLGISGKTGEGVIDLTELISRQVREYFEKCGSTCNNRHRNAMGKAIKSMEMAKENLKDIGINIEFVAEDIRQALLNLEDLLGKIDIEEVYGEIFSRFCIGK